MRHLPDAWLAASAAGTLDEAHDLLVAVHLTLCPTCRARVQLADTLAAEALHSAAEATPDPDGLAAVLARLDDAPEAPPAGDLPRSLLPWLDTPWRWLAPNVWGKDLPHDHPGELPLRMVWMRAGASLPHLHAGEEAAVVLQGGWTDATGHYGPGDVFTSDDRAQHTQVVDPDQPCVALVLNERPARLEGFLRLFAPFVRI